MDGSCNMSKIKILQFPIANTTACKQLFSTYDKFSKELKTWNYDYFCRAVVSNMPSPNNYPTSYRILMKNDKNKLICKTKKLEEHI